MQFESLDFENPKFLYLQVADNIENKIVNKAFTVGQKIPTVRELCKEFKVSITTMEEALSKLEKEGYISRRRSYGTFVVSSKPVKEIDLKRKNGICFTLCSHPEPNGSYKSDGFTFDNLYYQEIMEGVVKKVKDKNAYLIYNILREDEGKISLGGKEKDIAGMIFTGEFTRKHFKIIKKLKVPFVLIGNIVQKRKADEKVDIVDTDSFQGTYMAVKHLIDLGHKKIAYFYHYSGYFWEEEQLKGYKQALKDAGIVCERNLQVEMGGVDSKIGYIAMKKVLDKSVPFTALVVIGNNCVFGILQAIEEKGLKIPEDISVVSGRFSELTTVTYDLEELGRVAVDRLFYRLENPECQPERIIVPNRLTIRNSTRKLEKKEVVGIR
jgi:DNA-binding LacI/PurR family transcriptional regulator/DNA-binding transcriptional regulator YhcF (GntR family)